MDHCAVAIATTREANIGVLSCIMPGGDKPPTCPQDAVTAWIEISKLMLRASEALYGVAN